MGSTNTILVVDDEPLVKSLFLQKFKKRLSNKEFEFIFVSNGVEALKALEYNEDIGIIFTDINMPEMDGLTLLAKLVEHNRLYRVVVISAYSDITNIRTAMNSGASDFIIKPINFSDLEITLNKTIEQYNYISTALTAQNQVLEIQKELKIAKSIQQAFIPSDFRPFPNHQKLLIAGEMNSAKEVGGDFFDFFPLNDHLLGLLIADVSGKGIPAALFMAMSRTLFRAVALKCLSCEECMKQVNFMLNTDNCSSMFVTAFYGIFDINSLEFRYCNGGHNPPYILSQDGSLIQIGRDEGIALGASTAGKSMDYLKEKKRLLKCGDTLVLYTDGVVEATAIKRELDGIRFEMYGENRLEDYLRKSIQRPFEELIPNLMLDINNFSGGADQFDDITVLCMRCEI